MKCTKCTDGNMSLGILPYVRCNECDGSGLVVLDNFDELVDKWKPTGLLKDIQDQNGLALCFEKIYEDIIKIRTQKSHAKNDKGFQNALFMAQRRLHPINIRYQYSDRFDTYIITGSNGKIIEFSIEYLQDFSSIYERGPSFESELALVIHSGIIRS